MTLYHFCSQYQDAEGLHFIDGVIEKDPGLTCLKEYMVLKQEIIDNFKLTRRVHLVTESQGCCQWVPLSPDNLTVTSLTVLETYPTPYDFSKESKDYQERQLRKIGNT